MSCQVHVECCRRGLSIERWRRIASNHAAVAIDETGQPNWHGNPTNQSQIACVSCTTKYSLGAAVLRNHLLLPRSAFWIAARGMHGQLRHARSAPSMLRQRTTTHPKQCTALSRFAQSLALTQPHCGSSVLERTPAALASHPPDHAAPPAPSRRPPARRACAHAAPCVRATPAA